MFFFKFFCIDAPGLGLYLRGAVVLNASIAISQKHTGQPPNNVLC